MHAGVPAASHRPACRRADKELARRRRDDAEQVKKLRRRLTQAGLGLLRAMSPAPNACSFVTTIATPRIEPDPAGRERVGPAAAAAPQGRWDLFLLGVAHDH